MTQNKRPLGYLGGDIMGFGSNLARQYEYDKFIEMGLPVDVYSPVQNKSINSKNDVTEEENNKLAEKITAADIERLWNSDFVVIEPAQTAIGTMCELGCLFGWKYMCDRLLEIAEGNHEYPVLTVMDEIKRIANKDTYVHYFDIRNTQLNEKGWRRSFSINQLLYGMILYVSKSGDIESFDSILEKLKEKYGQG
jgi:nucleoside 2-deoxyribosyltransferase